MVETILQHPVLTRFAFPFLLVFFIIFAILEKTKLLGDNKQINALVAFVIGFIFIAVVGPVNIANNMILFLTVAIIVVFVALMIWGFIMGADGMKIFESAPKGLKWVIGIVIVVAVVIALLWSSGIEGGVFDLLFYQSWSADLWTNVAFIVVIAVALAVAIKGSK